MGKHMTQATRLLFALLAAATFFVSSGCNLFKKFKSGGTGDDVHSAGPGAPAGAASIRGAWLDWTSLRGFQSDAVKARAHLDTLVDKAKTAKLNTFYVIAWRYGCAKFLAINDPVGIKVPRCSESVDFLQEVINAIKRRGANIKVVPWFERPIGVGSHEPIYKATQEFYSSNKLLEPSNIFYTEGGFMFPMMNVAHPKVREILTAAMVSVVKNYNLEAIQIDDHLRLPAEHAQNPELIGKVIDFGNFWFAKFKGFFPGKRLEFAPLVLHFSVSRYGTDWMKWSSKIDRILLQCYKKGVAEATDDSDCYDVPSAVRSKFMGIGIYNYMNGETLNDAEVIGLVKKQITRKEAFVIFTLENLRASTAEGIGAL